MPQNLSGLSVYFASNSSELDETSIEAISEFMKAVKEYPGTTFNLNGYADKQAGDNQKLSEDRIEAVQKQLEGAHRVLPFRVLSTGFGNSLSQLVEDSEARRVDITTISARYAGEVAYRYALEQSWEGNMPQAMQALRMWRAHTSMERQTLLAYDPRAVAIREHLAYKEVIKSVASYYRSFPKPTYAKSLDSLWAEDQRYRTLNKWIENLNYYNQRYDSLDTRLDVWFQRDSASLRAHDIEILTCALELIDENGWPEETQVGKRAASAIPLAIIHSNDEELLTKYLPVMRRMCLKGEGHWRMVGYMEARLYHLDKAKEE